MLQSLKALLARWFGPPSDLGHSSEKRPQESIPTDAAPTVLHAEDVGAHPVAYDENLLEHARTQWQFGDWNSLAKLDRDTLQHHPERAKLALLAAAGRLQIGQDTEARQFIRLAQDWGVSKKLLTRILAAGVHNSLGRAAAIAGEQSRALQHFHSAIATGSPDSEARLLAQARIIQQYQHMGLPPPIAVSPPIGCRSPSSGVSGTGKEISQSRHYE